MALTEIKTASCKDQCKNYMKAQEHELKSRLAEVDRQLSLTLKWEDMDQPFLDVWTSIKQMEDTMKEEIEDDSPKAQSGTLAMDVDAQEHNILRHQCYEWLRGQSKTT